MEEKERKIRTLLWEAFLNSKGFFQKLFRYAILFPIDISLPIMYDLAEINPKDSIF